MSTKPKEAGGTKSPEAGVPGGSELLMWILGMELMSRDEAVYILNH